MKKQSTYIDFLFYPVLLIIFIYGASSAFIRGDYPFAGFVSLLSLFWVYLIWDSLRNGLRAPNRYEWFRYWMTLRPILFTLLGLGLIVLFAIYGRAVFGEALFESTPFMATAILLFLAWLGLIIFLIFRAPFRSESDESYKARISWKD